MSISPIDMILDENNSENIVLYNENDEAVEFEQIAVIPLDNRIYVILKPVDDDLLAEDEALVFVISPSEEDMTVVDDDDIVDAVFEEYYNMLRDSGIDV